MERLSQDEVDEVLYGLVASVLGIWKAAKGAYEYGNQEAGDYFSQRIVVAKSAYDKLKAWPYEPELDEPGEYPDGEYDRFGSSLDQKRYDE